jgi:hypothetical protein
MAQRGQALPAQERNTLLFHLPQESNWISAPDEIRKVIQAPAEPLISIVSSQ